MLLMLKQYIYWTYRELKNQKKFFILFTLNLSLGLTGFISLDTFRESLDRNLKDNSKKFLSADLAINSRRKITDEELKITQNSLPPFKETHLNEFFSMASASKNESSRLVQIRAIDNNYPFYGEIKLSKKPTLWDHPEFHQKPQIVVYPEIMAQLKVNIGENIKIGEIEYQLVDTITEDSSQTFRLSTLAPRVYISRSQVVDTKLLSQGATLSDVYLYKIEGDHDPKELRDSILSKITDPTFNVETPEDASQSTARTLNYLTDYLSLVSLVAIFLSALGTSFLFRSYINSKLKTLAIYNVLGFTKQKTMLLNMTLLFAVGLFSTLLGSLFSAGVIPILLKILSQITPIHLTATLIPKTLFIAVLLSTLGSLTVCLPYLVSLNNLKTSELFQENSLQTLNINFRKMGWTYLPCLVLFVGLTLVQSNSFITTLAFLGSLVLSIISVLGLSFLALGIVKNIKIKTWFFRHALLSVIRKPVESFVIILSLSMGVLLLNLMPQLKSALKEELQEPQTGKIPSIFLFDIQEDQAEPLKTFAKENDIEFQYFSPMVRGRIISVNDKSFERIVPPEGFKTREEEQEARSRNRGFNLSYREELSAAEEISEGESFDLVYDSTKQDIPYVSLEERFAERLGFKINDLILFDIQGVEVKAKVKNFRSVKWNSFQPNFFILFQTGVIDEAPKTFLTAIGNTSENKKNEIQNKIVQKFSNISMIDIQRTVDRIFELSKHMAWSLEFMAVLSLIVGFLVLISIITEQIQSRIWDLNMLKILGGSPKSIYKYILFEFGTIGFLSSCFGAALSLCVSFVISYSLFEGTFKIDFVSLFATILFTTMLSLGIAFLTSKNAIDKKPNLT